MRESDIELFTEDLIHNHGGEADLIAFRRAQTCNARGDMKNCSAWLDIHHRVVARLAAAESFKAGHSHY